MTADHVPVSPSGIGNTLMVFSSTFCCDIWMNPATTSSEKKRPAGCATWHAGPSNSKRISTRECVGETPNHKQTRHTRGPPRGSRGAWRGEKQEEAVAEQPPLSARQSLESVDDCLFFFWLTIDSLYILRNIGKNRQLFPGGLSRMHL